MHVLHTHIHVYTVKQYRETGKTIQTIYKYHLLIQTHPLIRQTLTHTV